jgi:hypothetical protein
MSGQTKPTLMCREHDIPLERGRHGWFYCCICVREPEPKPQVVAECCKVCGGALDHWQGSVACLEYRDRCRAPVKVTLMICTCAMHCTRSGYHERACCDGPLCECWCHEPRPVKAQRES